MDRYTTNTKISPTQVITIYNDRRKNTYYLEHRHVKNQGGRLTLQAPTPMGEDVFRNIAQAFIKTRAANVRFDGLIPEHILYGHSRLGITVVIWYRPAMSRLLNLSAHKGDATAEVPATLYVLKDKSLYIYALIDSKRPGLESRLYNAPFFNIYQDGRVCLGSARVGKKTSTFEGEAERYERAFYMAEQSSFADSDKCKTPLKRLWEQLIKSKKPFPAKAELIQHPKYRTLGGLIQSLIGKQNYDGDDN